MPPITEIGNLPPVQPATGEHGNHGATSGTVSTGSSGASFADALSQAISQPATPAAHGNHGGASTNAPHGGHAGANLTSPNGDSHPGHIPLAGQAHGGQHDFQAVALGLRAYRQQLIASNIANADTPGYKAVDIDFQEALRIAQSAAQTPPLPLATTAASHIPAQASSPLPPYPLKYHVPSQASADGNTVEMDVERSKMSENSLMYQFSLDRVSGHFKMLMELFQNLK